LTAETEGRAAAARFRHDHHLGVQALGDLLEVIEQATGVDVAVLYVGPDEHGLTMRDPARGTVFIGVARTRNPMRQRSTLAHELGHVLFEDWVDSDTGDWSDRSPAEIRADAFARHLLVPVEGLHEFIKPRSPVGPSTLSAVVQRFLVSPKIAAIAMRQAGYIGEATKQEWMTLSAPQLAARFGWTDQYQLLQASSDRRRAPQRLLARAITGYVEGVLSAQAIATLRGMSLEAVIKELEELATVVQRISGLPMDQRRRQPKDLGETMVIAHAVVAAESGQSVTILMDDGPGAAIATSEISRLQRLGSSGQPVGSITLASTLTVLGRAAGNQYLPDRAAMRDTYNRLRGLDDGLPPIENTDLLAPKLWS
jgi:Zn-dependent peptidase ImmA (M78 family)